MHAIDQLRRALGHRIVIVRGPAGIGKSVLLAQLGRSLDEEEGFHVHGFAGRDASRFRLFVDSARRKGRGVRRVLLVDDFEDDGAGITTEDILALLQSEENAVVVVATRWRTRLEDPLTALELDTYLLPPASLLLREDDAADILRRNGVAAERDSVSALVHRTAGWVSLIQVAATRLRFDGAEQMTEAAAAEVSVLATSAFVEQATRALPFAVDDDLKLSAVAPFLTGEALEGAVPEIRLAGRLEALKEAGLIWFDGTRERLIEPVRRVWLAEGEAKCPEEMDRVRRVLTHRLLEADEPLVAAELAAQLTDAYSLTEILRTDGGRIWRADPRRFAQLVVALRGAQHHDVRTLSALTAFDGESAVAPDYASRVFRAAGDIIRVDLSTLSVPERAAYVHLLRVTGHTNVALEAAKALSSAVAVASDPLDGADACEATYQIAMTFLLTGRLRDAAAAFITSSRSAVTGASRARARGCLALIAALEGDVVGVREELVRVTDARGISWLGSPWGEAARLARLFVATEEVVHTDTVIEVTASSAELWPITAAADALLHLSAGSAPDALNVIRAFHLRFRPVPVTSYLSRLLVGVRARILIALGQAATALDLVEGPSAHPELTVAATALAYLFLGRSHDAFVLTARWAARTDLAPRATAECLVLNAVAALRDGDAQLADGPLARAEAISRHADLWCVWRWATEEDLQLLLPLLSESARKRIGPHRPMLSSSVSVPRLSRRERVVLGALSPTTSNSEIADQLVVSRNTVKTQLRSLYRKLGVNDRVAALRVAHAWGLVTDEDADLTPLRPVGRRN